MWGFGVKGGQQELGFWVLGSRVKGWSFLECFAGPESYAFMPSAIDWNWLGGPPTL